MNYIPSTGAILGSVAGAGLGKEAVKQTGEYHKKVLDNRVKRAQMRNDLNLRKLTKQERIAIQNIKANVKMTDIRQKNFTKRYGLKHDYQSTVRNTAGEVINSFDKVFHKRTWTKKGVHNELELSPISLWILENQFFMPLLYYIHLESDDENLKTAIEYKMGIHGGTGEMIKLLIEGDPTVFTKKVQDSLYYTPPMEPDYTTDTGIDTGNVPFDYIEIEEEYPDQEEIIEDRGEKEIINSFIGVPIDQKVTEQFADQNPVFTE